MVYGSLVVGMRTGFVEREGNRSRDVHSSLLQKVFKGASVFHPCLCTGLGLHYWCLAVATVGGTHGEQAGEAVDAVCNVGGVAWPHTRVKPAQDKPHHCGTTSSVKNHKKWEQERFIKLEKGTNTCCLPGALATRPPWKSTWR